MMNTPARNSLCPCGSGKKYKKCCLINASTANDVAAQTGKSRSYGLNAMNVVPPSSLLMKGVTLHQAGRLNEAEAIYQLLLSNNPNDSDALHYLGLISYQRQRYPEAIKLIEAAIKINNKAPAFYCNLGNAYKALGQLDFAIVAYREAVRLDPQFQAAYSNLGAALKGRGNLEEAVASCRRALEIKPDFAEAHNNLGVALHNLGRPDEAADSYRRAIQIKPDYAEALLNLGHTCCMSDNLAEAAVSYQKAVKIDPANDGLEAAVYLSILSFLDGNFEQCKSMLSASREILTKTGAKHKNSCVYWCYLDKLLSANRPPDKKHFQTKEIEPLYVIGESHSLSAHRVEVRYRGQDMRCSAEWITGCKQWHLGNDKPNIYKYKFDTVMARLPRNSTVLLLIGEIDCRHDEGTVIAWKKYPDKSLDEIIQATVERYLKFIVATGGRYGHRIIVGGIPATNTPLSVLTKTEAEQLVNLIRLFNAGLKRQALASGMDFLDIYALTDRGDGIASGEWHIDNFHLQPNAIVEAFDRHISSIGQNGNTPKVEG
jgi:tetratricopeptide (TPR) repeat protein